MKNDYPEITAKIEKAINFFVEDLGSIRAGRASTTVLNRISVDYYGTMTPIPQVAAVATPDARTAEYYRVRPCADKVYEAAKIVEEMLKDTK